MRLGPGALQFLDHEPPAGAPLDRERRRRAGVGDELLQPAAQQHPVGRGNPPVPGLAVALVEVVKGDLPPVNVQPAYDPHRGPPEAPSQLTHPGCAELRGSLLMSSFPRPRQPAPSAGCGAVDWSSGRLGWARGSRHRSPHTVRRVRKKSATQPASFVVGQQRPMTKPLVNCRVHRSPHAAVHPGVGSGSSTPPNLPQCELRAATTAVGTLSPLGWQPRLAWTPRSARRRLSRGSTGLLFDHVFRRAAARGPGPRHRR
jgi:hypothetical protein